jgi:hypothetical protein
MENNTDRSGSTFFEMKPVEAYTGIGKPAIKK